MIKIKKIGNTEYGKWASFEYVAEFDSFIIRGIARHDLELEEEKDYTDLYLIINQRNDKIKYKIVDKL